MKRRITILALIIIQCVAAHAEKRPNFLFIITDDQTYETIGSLNNNQIKTPNIDKLAEQGVVFTHCFNQGAWNGAVCIASRTMLNTGRTIFRAPNNHCYLPGRHQKAGGESVKLWGETFRENGYSTFLTGKWHNSDLAVLKSFDKAEAVGSGMYGSYNKAGDKKAAYNRDGSDDKWQPWDSDWNGHWRPKVKDLIYDQAGKAQMSNRYTANKHTSELYADKAINHLLTNVKESDQPFFMYVAFNAPHDPRQAPKRFVDMYPVEDMEIPESYLPEHPFDQGDRKIRDEKLAPFPRSKRAIQLHQQEYYAIISHFDEELGRILDALERTGKADNTYIIFTSDHGLAVGRHGLMGKQNQYDHSIRMPLIVVGPNLKAGKKVDEMVYMQSMYATTCDLANISTPSTVEFRSIENLLTNKKAKGEQYIFGSYKSLQRMVRSDRYKLILYPDVKRGQLFDLKRDPNEMVDLYDNKRYKSVKEELFQKLREEQKRYGDQLNLNLY